MTDDTCTTCDETKPPADMYPGRRKSAVNSKVLTTCYQCQYELILNPETPALWALKMKQGTHNEVEIEHVKLLRKRVAERLVQYPPKNALKVAIKIQNMRFRSYYSINKEFHPLQMLERKPKKLPEALRTKLE